MGLRATIYLANVASFFHTRRRSTDLNQAEDCFPARFFVSFRTRNQRNQKAGKRKERAMKPLIRFRKTTPSLFMTARVMVCFALAPIARAVVPAPDGGYPGYNTAEGQNALLSLTSGTYNTAVGSFSLGSNTDGSYNTAVGAAALLFNIGDQSTGDGVQNTALGAAALLFNTTGSANTATGTLALYSNTEGDFNTATGNSALFSNTTGLTNTAVGTSALFDDAAGESNTATGAAALRNNIEGSSNTADGAFALYNNLADSNTAVGASAPSATPLARAARPPGLQPQEQHHRQRQYRYW